MNLSKRTAERMLQNIDKQLQALASRQQVMNGNVGGKMRKGGRVKMQGRGRVPSNQIPQYLDPNTKPYGGIRNPGMTNPFLGEDNWWNRLNAKSAPFGLDTANVYGQGNQQSPIGGGAPTRPTAVTDQNLARVNPQVNFGVGVNNRGFMNEKFIKGMPQFGQTLPNELMGSNNPAAQAGWQAPDTGMNWNNMMGMAPVGFNAIAGMLSGRADKLNPNEFQNPYESQAFGMMPDQFRVDDQLGDVRNQYANYMRNVRQVGNSRGEIMANAGAGMNRANEANTRIWAQKFNEENAMKTRKAMLRNQQGASRADRSLQVRDMNDANRAAARNRRMGYLGAAATGAQKYGLTQEYMKNQTASQNAYIDAFKASPFNQFEWFDEIFRKYANESAKGKKTT